MSKRALHWKTPDAQGDGRGRDHTLGSPAQPRVKTRNQEVMGVMPRASQHREQTVPARPQTYQQPQASASGYRLDKEEGPGD